MKLEIRPVKKEEYPIVYALQCDYLDEESFEDFFLESILFLTCTSRRLMMIN